MDSGSSLSVVTKATISKIQELISVEQFLHCSPNIVGVCNAFVRVLNYVDVTIDIAGLESRHLLIVVYKLAYLILVKINELKPHKAIIMTGASDIVRL